MNRVRGLSLIGLLITMACIVVLLSITLPAIRTATTGGSDRGGQSTTSAWATADRVNLNSIGQSMLAGGLGSGFDAEWLSPASVSRGRDIGLNTTANLYSLLIMEQRVQPLQLRRLHHGMEVVKKFGCSYVLGCFGRNALARRCRCILLRLVDGRP